MAKNWKFEMYVDDQHPEPVAKQIAAKVNSLKDNQAATAKVIMARPRNATYAAVFWNSSDTPTPPPTEPHGWTTTAVVDAHWDKDLCTKAEGFLDNLEEHQAAGAILNLLSGAETENHYLIEVTYPFSNP